MAKPIFKLFLFRNIEAYHKLSEAEKSTLMENLEAAFKKVGGKRLIVCNSSWSSEEWPVFGVEQFPDIEAVQKYSDLLAELNLSRYLDSWSILGTEWQD